MEFSVKAGAAHGSTIVDPNAPGTPLVIPEMVLAVRSRSLDPATPIRVDNISSTGIRVAQGETESN